MVNFFDVCDIAPQGSELRSLITTLYDVVPAWKNGYIRCEDICFHDIGVHDTLLIYQNETNFCLELPNLDDLNFFPEQTYVVVKCAEEKLKKCSFVHMKVKYDVVVEGSVTGRSERKCYLVWECQKELDITAFYTFKDWREVTGDDLSDYLRIVDGSSIVVDLNSEIEDGYVHVYGNIVDKLWKEENLVVMAAKPYDGVTITHEFKETKIPACSCHCR